MKLNIFNPWRELGNYFGRTLEYQTSKVKGRDKLFVTFIKDSKSNATVAKAYGMTDEGSKDAVIKLLKQVGAETVWDAIQTGQPIVPSQVQKPAEPKKDIQWRDGIGHSYKAQKKIVGEAAESADKKDKPHIRNYVAKHARAVNKGGPMKDKKNDYSRKPKHKSRDAE